MEYKILNRVSKSKIKTIDFNDFITIYNYEIIDLKDWLKNDLILIESDFRKKLMYLFSSLNKLGSTIIMTTNDLSQFDESCRIITLDT